MSTPDKGDGPGGSVLPAEVRSDDEGLEGPGEHGEVVLGQRMAFGPITGDTVLVCRYPKYLGPVPCEVYDLYIWERDQTFAIQSERNYWDFLSH